MVGLSENIITISIAIIVLSDVFPFTVTVGTRTVGVISKVDQANGDAKTIACVQALLSNKGPKNLQTFDFSIC